MKFVIAVLCVVGIAFVSSAPIDDQEAEVPTEGIEPRAAEIPVNVAGHAKERAAAAGVEDRASVPHPREIFRALETKYLTPDGQELVKSVLRV